jgi:hypothetical protein
VFDIDVVIGFRVLSEHVRNVEIFTPVVTQVGLRFIQLLRRLLRNRTNFAQEPPLRGVLVIQVNSRTGFHEFLHVLNLTFQLIQVALLEITIFLK